MAAGRIEQVIDLVVKGLKDVQQAEKTVKGIDGTKATVSVDADTKKATGAFSTLKTAGSDALSFVKDNAASLALGAGGAIAGFAAKAVGDFQEVALGAGELRDSLGLTAEEASRWQEVAGDLGISNQTLESVINKMNKTLGASPGLFKELGVEVAKTSSGATDVNGTFLNVIGALNGIQDPAERAAAGTKLLGKSWADMSELIGVGAVNVKASLADVEDAKIIDDKEIDKARKFRDTMDNLHDVIEDVSIAVGDELVPALSNAGDQLLALLGPAKNVYDTFNKFTDLPGIKQVYENFAPWEQLPTRIHQVSSAWTKAREAFTAGPEDIKASIDLTDSLNADAQSAEFAKGAFGALADPLARMRDDVASVSDNLAEHEAHMDASKAAAEGWAKIQQEAADQLDRVNQKLNEQADALNAQVGAATDAADAQRDENKSLEDYATVLGDSKSKTDEVVDSAIKLAKAHQETANAQAAATGQTLTATQKLDTLNQGLLSTAATAKGPARQGILDYIASVNQIPPEKLTEIQAAIDRGDLALANTLLAQASAPRTAAINADANTAAAQRDLDRLTANRTVLITPVAGQIVRRDAGGVAPTGGAWGGELGPEFVTTPDGRRMLLTAPTLLPARTRITRRSLTERMLTTSGGSPVWATAIAAGRPIKVDVKVSGMAGNRFEVDRAIKRSVRDGIRLAGNR